MIIKNLPVIVSFFVVLGCWPAAGWAQAGRPVMDAAVSILPDNNIVRVSWAPQAGVGQYTVERWEAQGTDFWHFNVNDTMKPTDQTLKIRGMELERKVFIHPANPGKMVELYDQDVKPRYTYFYRVNGGRIAAVETRKKPVIPLTEEKKNEISKRQAGEQEEIDREGGGSSWSERSRAYEQSADYPERLAADLIMAIPNWLIEVIGLYDPMELVFEIDLQESFKKKEAPSVARKDLVWNIYSKDEFRVIGDFYNNVRQAVPVFMAAGIAIAGMLVLFGSTSSRSAHTARGYIMGILLCALLLKLGPYLLGFFFDVNRAIVAVCHSTIADQVHQSFLHSIYNKETRSIGSALMALTACLSIGVINFQFAVRKVFLAILVGILPIVLINAIYPGRRNALAVWTREFTSYVFMPACFAVGLSFFIHFLNSDQFWVTLVCLLSLPAINSLVRGVLGLSDAGFTAGVGSALGMGALFSMGSMLSGGGEGKGGAAQNPAAGGLAGGPGVGSVLAKGVAGSALAGGAAGAALGKGAPGVVGSVARGAVGLGVAGSMALAGSMVSGAAAGDSGAGLEFGARAGKAAGSALNSAGSSMKGFLSEVKEKGLTGATGIVDGSMLMDPGVTSSIAARALGGNAIGNTAAATAASASRAARFVSPLVAPEARERLDRVSELAGQTTDISGEFEKIRQAQHFRKMFDKIQKSRHPGGSGGIYGSTWR
ncbi:MAG: hypothetical protein ACOY40_04670 [Bacillota bacterium]